MRLMRNSYAEAANKLYRRWGVDWPQFHAFVSHFDQARTLSSSCICSASLRIGHHRADRAAATANDERDFVAGPLPTLLRTTHATDDR